MMATRFPRGEAFEQFRGSATTRANNARRAKTNSGRAAGIALEKALSQVANAVEESRRIAGNTRAYPPARKQDVQERREQAQQVMQDALRSADGLLQLHKQELLDAAMPRMSRGEESLARQDAVAFLGATPAGQRADLMRSLARRNDSVGALVTSDWGRTYLQSSGYGQEADTLHNAVRMAALEAAPESGDQNRKDAAMAYGDPELGKARNEAAYVMDAGVSHLDELAEAGGHDPNVDEIHRLRDIAEHQRAEIDRLRGGEQAAE